MKAKNTFQFYMVIDCMGASINLIGTKRILLHKCKDLDSSQFSLVEL